MASIKHLYGGGAHLKMISDWQQLCKRDFAKLIRHPSLPLCVNTAIIEQASIAVNDTTGRGVSKKKSVRRFIQQNCNAASDGEEGHSSGSQWGQVVFILKSSFN